MAVGAVEAVIFASCDCRDFDLWARLYDVHPDGRVMNLMTPGQDVLRASYRDPEAGRALLEPGRVYELKLANLLTAGDEAPVAAALERMLAMRAYMRAKNVDGRIDPSIPERVGMTTALMEDMYRLMAIAKYEERYVIPTAYQEQAHELEELGCALDYDDGPGMYESGPFGEASGRPTPVAVETFAALRERQSSDAPPAGDELRTERVNLLNWDGNGSPTGLFP